MTRELSRSLLARGWLACRGEEISVFFVRERALEGQGL